jgi:beta-phosphoglucomutase
MTDTIIFDCEGVVADTETIWDISQREFLHRRGRVYDREKIKPMLTGKTLLEGVRILKREYGFSGDSGKLALERKEIFRNLIEQKVDFIDGFLDFFSIIREDYKTCIATSMDEDLLEIVDRRLGLSKLFDNKVFSLVSVMHNSKPASDIFLYAAQQLGSISENCVVIEDSPYGVEAAKRAGMKCIGLTTTYGRDILEQADLVVDSYSNINLKYLEEKSSTSPHMS